MKNFEPVDWIILVLISMLIICAVAVTMSSLMFCLPKSPEQKAADELKAIRQELQEMRKQNTKNP